MPKQRSFLRAMGLAPYRECRRALAPRSKRRLGCCRPRYPLSACRKIRTTVTAGHGAKRRHPAPRGRAPRDRPARGGRPPAPAAPPRPPRPSRRPLRPLDRATCGLSEGSTKGVAVGADLACPSAGEAREPFRSRLGGATAACTGLEQTARGGGRLPCKRCGQMGESEASSDGCKLRAVTSRGRPAPAHEAHRRSAGTTGRRPVRAGAAAELRPGRRVGVLLRAS